MPQARVAGTAEFWFLVAVLGMITLVVATWWPSPSLDVSPVNQPTTGFTVTPAVGGR